MKLGGRREIKGDMIFSCCGWKKPAPFTAWENKAPLYPERLLQQSPDSGLKSCGTLNSKGSPEFGGKEGIPPLGSPCPQLKTVPQMIKMF